MWVETGVTDRRVLQTSSADDESITAVRRLARKIDPLLLAVWLVAWGMVALLHRL
jgi:hypothetical protein